MQLKLATIFTALTAALFGAPAVAQSVSYEGFASTVSCSGSAFGCTDGGNVCCSLPTGFGFSVQFNNLPSGTQGQGYTNNGCSSFLFALFGPGTKCFNGGGTRATNMNWFHSPQGRRGIEARAAAEAATNCSSPAYFKYEDASGAAKQIKVPAASGAAQTIADLFTAKNFGALAKYEDY
ncbi:hypothetical protein BDZ97DRAFT_1662913 [Flammula alnicola]|nr:hypothetical protein BDZ97DRAFT_1662913 [Flammula alnicola]